VSDEQSQLLVTHEWGGQSSAKKLTRVPPPDLLAEARRPGDV
jgi:hypothetical protein